MVLKVITIYNKDTDSIEEVLLEELQVFQVLYFAVQSALQQLNDAQYHQYMTDTQQLQLPLL